MKTLSHLRSGFSLFITENGHVCRNEGVKGGGGGRGGRKKKLFKQDVRELLVHVCLDG